jgi:MarR family transcriptional regulator, organic hydroperoxide resistance regulator
MDYNSLVPLDSQLCFSLYGASIAINRAYKPLLDRLGVTYPQYLVVVTLAEQDDQTIGEIADRLGLEPSTITPLVKRMEQAGLLVRRRNPHDEREVKVTLSNAGRGLHAKSDCLTHELLKRSGMTVEEMVAFNRQVQKLRDSVAGESDAAN